MVLANAEARAVRTWRRAGPEAREGIRARLTWLDGEEVLAQPFLLDRLLPLAEAGLKRQNVDDGDIARYLGVLEKRRAGADSTRSPRTRDKSP